MNDNTPAVERARLDNIASNSLYGVGANARTISYSYHVFQRFMRGSTVCEFGPAEGIMTDLLVKAGYEMTVVEGAERFCDDLRRRHPHITIHHALFEEFETDARFDNIVLGHVLEHVTEPADIVRRLSRLLTPDGRMLAAVPNSRSMHRQAAVIMGLLPHEEVLNEMDLHHGHRRVFNPESFRRCFQEAGLRIEHFGGYWLKPVSNRQIEDSWTPQMLDAFMQLGERYPDIAGEIYIVARR